MKTLDITSKIVRVDNSDEKIFNFLADFRNIARYIQPEAKNLSTDVDTCSFTIKGVPLCVNIVEREPFSLIKAAITGQAAPNGFMWIQLKKLTAYETAARIVIRSQANIIVRAAIKRPMQRSINYFADMIKMIPY